MPYPRQTTRRHPADLHAEAQIARAVSFNVHFRKGPRETFNEAADSLEAARVAADRLNQAHGRNGRRAIVYAITPEGVSWPVTLPVRA